MISGWVIFEQGKVVKQDVTSLSEVMQDLPSSSFIWAEFVSPTDTEIEELQALFNLHELAVEDAKHAHQRPKIEEFDDSLFVVLRSASYAKDRREVELGELHLFAGRNYIVTVRHGDNSLNLPRLHERLCHRPELMRLGPDAVLYAVMDQIVDEYLPVIYALESDVDDVEAEVFSSAARETTERIYALKREVLKLRRATSPLLLPVERLYQGEYPQIDEGVRHYFRDVHDHLQRVDDQVESFRELLTNILEANVALVSVHQNDIVRKISGWAAIIAVPTLITGIYGMNFKHMPELNSPLGYPAALTAMVLVSVGLYTLLKRVEWL